MTDAAVTNAAVLVGPRTIQIRELPLPDIGPDAGLLSVEAAGVCGSDIEPYLRGGGPMGTRRIETPVVLGHEVVGRVVEIGDDARRRWGVAPGDRVLVERWLPCGACAACRAAAFPQCERTLDGHDLFYGGTPTTVYPGLWGGFAEHMYLHPDAIVHKVSNDTPAHIYPLFLPLANAVSWITLTGRLRLGESVLIQGPGPVGLCCVLVARAAGAARIVVSGLARDSERPALARDFGATDIVRADIDDVAEVVRAATGGEGADLVIDVTAGTSLIPVRTAVAAAARAGRVILTSDHGGTDIAAADLLTPVIAKTLTVTGVRSRHREAVITAINLLDDPHWAAQLNKMCCPVLGLRQTQAAFESVVSGDALHASIAITADTPEGEG